MFADPLPIENPFTLKADEFIDAQDLSLSSSISHSTSVAFPSSTIQLQDNGLQVKTELLDPSTLLNLGECSTDLAPSTFDGLDLLPTDILAMSDPQDSTQPGSTGSSLNSMLMGDLSFDNSSDIPAFGSPSSSSEAQSPPHDLSSIASSPHSPFSPQSPLSPPISPNSNLQSAPSSQLLSPQIQCLPMHGGMMPSAARPAPAPFPSVSTRGTMSRPSLEKKQQRSRRAASKSKSSDDDSGSDTKLDVKKRSATGRKRAATSSSAALCAASTSPDNADDASPDQPDGDDKKSKRERNKVSAMKYRKRRKVYLDSLEGKVGDLTETVTALHTENKLLKEQLEFLKTLVSYKNTTDLPVKFDPSKPVSSQMVPLPPRVHAPMAKGMMPLLLLALILCIMPFAGLTIFTPIGPAGSTDAAVVECNSPMSRQLQGFESMEPIQEYLPRTAASRGSGAVDSPMIQSLLPILSSSSSTPSTPSTLISASPSSESCICANASSENDTVPDRPKEACTCAPALDSHEQPVDAEELIPYLKTSNLVQEPQPVLVN
jgi:hypothetical protein